MWIKADLQKAQNEKEDFGGELPTAPTARGCGLVPAIYIGFL